MGIDWKVSHCWLLMKLMVQLEETCNGAIFEKWLFSWFWWIAYSFFASTPDSFGLDRVGTDSVVAAWPPAGFVGQLSVQWLESLQNRQRFLSIWCCHSCWVSLPCESNLPIRSICRVDGFKSLGLFGFCSKWLSEWGAGFGVDDRAADVDEVDDFGGFWHWICCS